MKTVGYQQPDQATPPPTIVALPELSVITFPPTTVAPSPVLSPVPMDTSDLVGTAAPKFNLFVTGTKCKAKRLAKDHQEDIQVPKPKPKLKAMKTDTKPQEDIARLSKRRKIIRSKIIVSDDDEEDNDDDAVIIVKKVSDPFFTPTALIDIFQPGTSALAVKSVPAGHVVPGPSAGTSSTLSNLTDVDELEEPQLSHADSSVIRVRSHHVLSLAIY